MRFNSLDDIRTFCRDLPAGDAHAAEAAALRQQNLTKPPGSLGRLEELAIWLARWQGDATPRLDRVTIVVFAGNHGIAARGVSAYPPEVTAQMVANFAAGGAAINQIASSSRRPRLPGGLVRFCCRWAAAPTDCASPAGRSRQNVRMSSRLLNRMRFPYNVT